MLRVRQRSDARLDSSLGHGVGDDSDQACIQRLGNDVLTTEFQAVHAVGFAYFLGNRLLGQVFQRDGSGDFHFFVARRGR